MNDNFATKINPLEQAGVNPSPKTAEEPDMRFCVDVSSSIPLIRRTENLFRQVTSHQQANIYKQDGSPVRITGVNENKPRIEWLTLDTLRYEVSRAVKCYEVKMQGRGNNREEIEVEVEPPLSVIRNILGMGDFPLPTLMGITHHPTITRKGDIVYTSGYDYDTGLFLVPNELAIIRARRIPENPSDADIQQAVSVLEDMLGEFPFVSDADKANALAGFLTVLCRPLIEGLAPAFLFQAPTPGTGKGLLTETLLTAAMGIKTEATILGEDEAEIKKQLTSVLLNGEEYLFFDNISPTLKSNTLSGVITSGRYQDRLLGGNRMAKFTVKSPIFFTGNNPKPNDEMVRRCISVRLDANMERPWERTGFKVKDKKNHTLEHHPEYAAAGLTLAKAWVSRGRVPGEKTLGSFEAWAETIGGILETAGISGFMDNAKAFYESADTESANWAAFVQAWADTHKETLVQTKDLYQIAIDTEVISDKTTIKGFGRYLAQKQEQVIAGFKIMKQRTTKARGLFLKSATPSL